MRCSKDSTRFPYTYACDWIRMERGTNFSRSDASQEISALAESLGRSKAEIAEEMAREYIYHWNAIEQLEDSGKRQRAEWIDRIDAVIAKADQ